MSLMKGRPAHFSGLEEHVEMEAVWPLHKEKDPLSLHVLTFVVAEFVFDTA